MPTKVKELVAQLEADGWFLVRTKVVIANSIIRPNPVPLPCPASSVWKCRSEHLVARSGKLA